MRKWRKVDMNMIYSNDGLDEKKTKIMILNIINMEEDNRIIKKNNITMVADIANMIKKEVEKK